MADTKISGLAAGAPAQATDLIPIARSGANYSITPANILAYGSSPVAGTTAAFSSTLAAGATTITGAATVSTTLGVTGASTLAALSATTGTFSGNLTLSSATAAIAMGTAAGYGYIGNSSGAAYLEFDGPSHATTANQAFLRADNYSFKTVSGTTILNASSGAVAVTGTLSATTGAAVGGATAGAGGLAFPATAVAVADANTLDDYEEGTWTPSVGGTATYSGQTGLYTKIGRMVYIQCYLDILLIGTGSTTTISGLPFASVNVQGLGMCSQFLNLNTNLIAPGFFPSGSNLRNAGLATAAANGSADNAIFQSTTRVDFSCSYMAS